MRQGHGLLHGRDRDEALRLHEARQEDSRSSTATCLWVEAEVAPHADPRSIRKCRKIAIDWLQARMGVSLPRKATAHRSFSHTGADSACRAVRLRNGRGDYWGARLEHTPREGQATVTEIIVAHPEGNAPLVGIEVVDRSVVPTEPTGEYPAEMLAEIADRVPLLQSGRTLSHEPIVVESADTLHGFHRMLVEPGRRMPFAVVSVPPDLKDLGPLERQWASLARALTGLAIVWVLPPKMTYRLSDHVSKSLSVFLGAWRFYRPGFTHLADRNHHPLVLRNRMEGDRGVKEAMRKFLIMAVQERMRAGFDRQLSIGFDDLAREETGAVRGPARLVALLRGTRRPTEPPSPEYVGGADSGHVLVDRGTEQTPAVSARVREHAQAAADRGAATPDGAVPMGRRLHPPDERARTQAKRYEEAIRRADRAERERDEAVERAARLAKMVQALGGDPDLVPAFPTEWEQFAPWCEQHLGECVSLAGTARRELSSVEFENVELAARCVHWLAYAYRNECLRGGSPQRRVRDCNIDDQVVNLHCGADCLECKWKGRNRRVEWCLQCGSDTCDPRRSLRIYYFWDDESERVVVASMPSLPEAARN